MSTPDGVLLLDKPRGPSSAEVVDRVRFLLGGGRAGHAGTLDPAASGLLIVALGAATRVVPILQAHAKRYVMRVRFGVRTDTDDATGRVVEERPLEGPLEAARIEHAAERFLGEFLQRPPAASAIRVQGERAYRRMRRGEDIAPPERRVRVDSIRVLEVRDATALLDVRCGPGTYLRALARDIGGALGCGAIAEELRRTESGPFRVDAALPEARWTPEELRAACMPLDRALAFLPAVQLDGERLRKFTQGAAVEVEGVWGTARVADARGVFAIGEARRGRLKPVRMVRGVEAQAPRA